MPETTATHDTAPRDAWRALPADLDAPEAATTLTRHQARSWELVLRARLIDQRSRRERSGWQLLVRDEDFARALDELRRFEGENRSWPPRPPSPPHLLENRVTTLWVLIGLAVFYNLTLQPIDLAGHHPVDWLALGNADAGRIVAGEWWRTATALTLHADWQHLLGNLLIGGLFVTRLCRDLGSGLGWLLLLTTGMLGNLINAWLQSPAHRAVGASTAVFGAVGLLAAISLVRYRRVLSQHRRWPLPLAAALGLLAMLGAGGDNTDLGAHLFGFLCGLGLGMPTAWLTGRLGQPTILYNILFGVLCGALLGLAWWLALLAGGTLPPPH